MSIGRNLLSEVLSVLLHAHVLDSVDNRGSAVYYANRNTRYTKNISKLSSIVLFISARFLETTLYQT